jgi:uncharacterized membrane protein
MTIRNPIEWGWAHLHDAAHAVGSAGRAVGRVPVGSAAAPPTVRRITVHDIQDALHRGVEDFGEHRTDVIFLALIYPLAGLLLARVAFGYDMLPLLFPLASGFALLGPVAAVGLYEMSRRREQGAVIGWGDAFGVVRSPSFASIVVLGFVLLAIFAFWILAADMIYSVTLGPAPPTSALQFAHDVLLTPAGWAMIVVGCGVGFLFAALVLAISVVSFPLLLDRDVGLGTAIETSIRAVIANPGPMALWGIIVSAGLVLGSIPLLVGLIVVMPILGHATWHLYRKVTGTGPLL